MLLSQIKMDDGTRMVVARQGDVANIVNDVRTTYELALSAIKAGRTLAEEVAARGLGEKVDLAALLETGRVLLPIDHEDASHMHLTGTGLTHMGSASTRNAMHTKSDTQADQENLTDSMKMFRMGLEGGRPQSGQVGVQPEWFYKGNGDTAVAAGEPLVSPSFALDAGEEPELAGIYIIGEDATPYRIGFALANEFSDHVTERGNYLWLAHSKLRPASFGPEMLIGDLPDHVEGMSRILRDGKVIWEKPFLSGEENMSHSLGNLEHHHFKYDLFRKSGDVHVHFFGTATLSFSYGIQVVSGDEFEISSPSFGLPLRNALLQHPAQAGTITIKSL